MPPPDTANHHLRRRASTCRRGALLRSTGGATSAVDRVHTALHGYLRAACDDYGITYPPDESLTGLFKRLREQHAALSLSGPRTDDIRRLLGAMSTILDALNPLRNRASLAHANDNLLDRPEAMLVINAARTVLYYLDEKLPRQS